jgi:D-alanyl-D-alanine carboxypeptidase
MKLGLCFIASLLLLACNAGAAEVSAQQRTEQLEELLLELKERYHIPAAGVIVVNSDGVIDSLSIGVRDMNGTDPATAADFFHLGSNTKAITAFIAGKLVREGVIAWDSRFFDLVPELADESQGGYAAVTLGDLLSHRARIVPFVSGTEMEAIPVLEGDIVDRRVQFAGYILAMRPTRRSPQSRFKRYAYSNAGYVLAAVMMERASGSSWEELVERVMVDDLGLALHVGFPVDLGPDQPRGHLPGAYLGESRDFLMVYDTDYVLAHEDEMSPAGNLSMPMTAYARFIQLHLRGLRGENNYLSAETYHFMHFGVNQYAMGWENSRRRGAAFSEHSGSRGNFFCHVRIIPEQDLAIIAFANSGILNALDPVSYVFGGMRLARFFNSIESLYVR